MTVAARHARARSRSLGASSQSERSIPLGIRRTRTPGCSAAILSTLSWDTAHTNSERVSASSSTGRRRVENTAASKSLPRIRVISGTPSHAANTGAAMIGREPPNATTCVMLRVAGSASSVLHARLSACAGSSSIGHAR